MAKKELRLHALVAPTETVIASAYDKDGRADACTLAFYMVSSHIPPCVTIAINATQKRKTRTGTKSRISSGILRSSSLIGTAMLWRGLNRLPICQKLKLV